MISCKVSNELVWLCMVLYGLSQLGTIFVLVFVKAKIYKSWRETGQLASCYTSIYGFLSLLIHRLIDPLKNFVFID